MKKNLVNRFVLQPQSVTQFLFTAILISVLALLTYTTKAQPYLDIAGLKYVNSPNPGKLSPNAFKYQYINAGTNLPIQFRNKKDVLIFSPYYEKWWSQIACSPRQVHSGIGLPVTLIKSLKDPAWSILVSLIVRMNDSVISSSSNVQVGGAFLVNYKPKKDLTWKLGIYVNNELFAVFVMPLAGIDWRINKKNNLFGVLPGNLVYEHKINEHFYYGANFRAITNSYGNGLSKSYWRVDENQLGIYLDSYFNKNLVLTAEGGYSLFRKFRTGIKDVSRYDPKVKDNLYFRIGAAYRVRFKG